METIKTMISWNIRPALLILMLVSGISSCTGAKAQPPAENDKNSDKTLSPYFVVLGGDSDTDQLPLKSTRANVNIAGVIADVKVTQVYKNEGKKTLEAIYVFPASTRAAVYDMKMTIGERVIQAVVMEREQARQNYEQAKQQGKSASLLEQERPNVFQMNVANILPGDEIKVELYYTELLIPEKGVYEFVYPTVVGPRYSNKDAGAAASNDQWVSNPYTTEGKKPAYTFDINLSLNAGMPVKDVSCPTHDADIAYQNASTVKVGLKKGSDFEGNRDFILRYRLQGGKIQSGVLLNEGKDENFFLAMVQPPQRVTPDQIPPREFVFIMDVSGSMNGFPIDISKKLMRNLLNHLRSTDKFNVILFAGCSNLLSETSLPVTEENIKKALKLIDEQQGSGGTELLPALERALTLKGVEGYSRTFVIATDGYVDIEKDAFDLIRNNLGAANFFAFGIGTSVNRYIIEGMARVGKGEPFVIEQPEKAEAMAEQFREYIQTPLLTHVKIKFEGFDAYDVEPLTVPDLLAERPLLIYGKYRGKATGKLIVTGKTGEGDFSQSYTMESVNASPENNAVKYLWARNRIMLLDDYSKVPGNDKDLKGQVTALGLKYNLLTAYTSFIAIDSEIRNNTGNSVTVKQALPLPQGVSNYAVGGAAPRGAMMKSMSAPAMAANSYRKTENVELEDAMEYKKEDEAFLSVEQSATFMGGGLVKFSKYVQENLKITREMAEKCLSGKVFVQFTIDEKGNIANIKILRSLDPLFDQEVIRVIQNAPTWKPAKQGGKNVKQVFTLPVSFVVSSTH